jgi:thymidylate kinase
MINTGGPLILIDGPQGSGADTLKKDLVPGLRLTGVDVFVFNSLLYGDIGDKIAALQEETAGLSPREYQEKARVLIRERAEVYREVVVPRLKENALVLALGEELRALAMLPQERLGIGEVYRMYRGAGIPSPHLAVITQCPPDLAQLRDTRVVQREREASVGLWGQRTEDRERIHYRYSAVESFLEREGKGRVLSIDTERQTPDQAVGEVFNYLMQDTPKVSR